MQDDKIDTDRNGINAKALFFSFSPDSEKTYIKNGYMRSEEEFPPDLNAIIFKPMQPQSTRRI